MSKLSRMGPDEASAIKKLCQWSAQDIKFLMEVVNRLEIYEAADVKASGNAEFRTIVSKAGELKGVSWSFKTWPTCCKSRRSGRCHMRTGLGRS